MLRCFRWLAALLCLFLASCFDIREEVWIERDGSGHGTLTYTVPASALRIGGGQAAIEEKIRTAIAAEPELTLQSLTITPAADGRVVMEGRIAVRSFYALARDLREKKGTTSMPDMAVKIAGKFSAKFSGLSLDFSRDVRIHEAFGLSAFAISGAERKERRITYVVHLPSVATSSNATHIRDGGRTLMWDHTLGDALKGPIVAKFVAPVPVPKWIWPLLAAVPVLLFLVIRRFRARRRLRLSESAVSPP